MENRFKIILFSVAHSDTLYHYSSSTLPILGDILEIEKGRTHFKISDTFLLPPPDSGNMAAYILCGTFTGRQLSASNFKNLKHRIHHTANLDVELNSYGRVIFPETLN